jgi:hypothetical protein
MGVLYAGKAQFTAGLALGTTLQHSPLKAIGGGGGALRQQKPSVVKLATIPGGHGFAPGMGGCAPAKD